MGGIDSMSVGVLGPAAAGKKLFLFMSRIGHNLSCSSQRPGGMQVLEGLQVAAKSGNAAPSCRVVQRCGHVYLCFRM